MAENMDKCCVCLSEYDDINYIKFPIHEAINGLYHFICIQCFKKLNKLEKTQCPQCKEDFDFITNKEKITTLFEACKENNELKAMRILNNNNFMLFQN
jgi:predicted amidophosphoribosyltransferase